MTDASASKPGTRLLYFGPFVSTFDRFAFAPLILPISRDFHAPLAEVALAASLYYFVYGGMQPVWGILSDQFGRVRVLRTAFFGITCMGLLSSLAPSLPVLIVGRAFTGAFVAAVISTSLVYIGDTFPFRVRQRAIANLGAAVATGTAMALLGSGILSDFVNWRLAFAVPAMVALALGLAFGRVPESLARHSGDSPLSRIRLVLAEPWALLLIILGFAEGGVLHGIFTYLPSALEAGGVSATVAGLVVAAYGLSVVGSTELVKRATGKAPAAALLAAGAGILLVGYAIAAIRQDVPGILTASIATGASYGFMHSTIQTWITEVVPEARGTATSLFACALFTGAAVATGLAAGLAQADDYGRIFAGAALATVPVLIVGSIARWRYPGSTSSSRAASPVGAR